MSGPARFFIIAVLFFLVTAGGAVFYLVYGGRSVSTNNVTIAVQGPTTISSGDVVPLLITIENKNPVAIRGVGVTLTFPDGTKSPDDPTKNISVTTEDLGDIESGQKVEKTVRATVFGSEGQHVSLPLRIEYHTDSSNAVFVKNKQYEFTITTSPVSLNVTSLSQVSAGQTVTVDAVVRSNAATPLDNVAVLVEYPFGFAPSSVTPQPSVANNLLFTLGTLAPGEEKHIVIKGVLSGENNDDRVFKFKAGTLTTPESVTLTTAFSSKDAIIKLTKPFLATTLSVNRDSTDNPVVDAGSPVQVIISWVNTLPNPISNARVTVVLSGEALDPATVSASGGFYRSSDSTVLFDSSTNPALTNLQPGDTGQGSFSFIPKKNSLLANLRNPSITMRVSVAGSRLSETSVPEVITSTITRTIKIGTNLGLTSRMVRSVGGIANTGPFPPEVDKESTYTVVYALSNTGNNVAGAKVTAALPPYVRFTGVTNPSDGSVTYNDTTRTVTWNAGDVSSGSTNAKTVSFQIGFTPSITQRGSYPILINAQQVTGVDRFTGRTITGSVSGLSSQVLTDPAYGAGDASVK